MGGGMLTGDVSAHHVQVCLILIIEQREVLPGMPGSTDLGHLPLAADTPHVPVKPARMKREPTFTPCQRPEPTTPGKGGADHFNGVVRHALS